jgi:D-alanyl-D-alanine carboxypeptidase
VIAAPLPERGFANNALSWLRPTLGTVDNLVPIDASPPNLRDEMCGGKRHKPASDEDEDTVASNGSGASTSGESAITFFTAGLQPPMAKPSELLAAAPEPSEPIVVYTGPTRTGAALIAAETADADKQAPRHHAKKTRVADKKSDGEAEPKGEAKESGKRSSKDARPDAKSSEPKSAAKPAAIKHANAKPDAAPKATEKPVAAGDKPALKRAKPKVVAKPKSTTTDAKPADQKTTAEPHS